MDRPLGDEKSATFSFEIERQSGNDVLTVESLAVGYEGKKSQTTSRFGPIKGKHCISGTKWNWEIDTPQNDYQKLPALGGDIRYGTNLQIGYYDQEQAELTSNKRVLNELWDEYPLKPEKKYITVLGNFLFSGDDVLKIVSTLSGGERLD